MYHILFTCSPVDGHLFCFQFLAITNKVAMKIQIHIVMWTEAVVSLGKKTKQQQQQTEEWSG